MTSRPAEILPGAPSENVLLLARQHDKDATAEADALRTSRSYANQRRRLPLSPVRLAAVIAAGDLVALGVGWWSFSVAIYRGIDTHLLVSFGSLVVPLSIVLGWIRGGYDRSKLFRVWSQLGAVLPGLVVSWALCMVAAFAFSAAGDLRNMSLLSALLCSGLCLSGFRITVVRMMAGALGQISAPRAVIVGAGSSLPAFLARHGAQLDLLGVIAEHEPLRCPARYLGALDVLHRMLEQGRVDQLFLTEIPSAWARTMLLEPVALYPVEVFFVQPMVRGRGGGGLETAPRMVAVEQVMRPPIYGWRGGLKRIVDYIGAVLALVLMVIPMSAIAIAIRMDSEGPIIFRQRRVGLNGSEFFVLKFRTIQHKAADYDAGCQVVHGDRRVTRVGAFLRKTSLDEIPQIFNVLRGEMSLVGPRPHAPGTRAGSSLFHEVLSDYSLRHRVKPGITGLAQVRGFRGPTLNEEALENRVSSDLEYIQSWSLWLDVAILARTVVEVLRMRNAH